MSLHLLPRYAPSNVEATTAALLRAEPTLDHGVRQRARRALSAALAAGRLSARDIKQATAMGDAGVAGLMREQARLPPCPRIETHSLPRSGEPGLRPAQIEALAPWVSLLVKSRCLDPAQIQSMASIGVNRADLYVLLTLAWQRFVSKTLGGCALPGHLPPGVSTLFSVTPEALMSVAGQDAPANPSPFSICVQHLTIRHAAMRCTDDDDRAMTGALADFARSLWLPLLCEPQLGYVDEIYYLNELFDDMETICQWDEVGSPTIPLAQAQTMMENMGMDVHDDALIHEATEHLAWRRWSQSTPPIKPGAHQAQQWLHRRRGTTLAAVYEAIVQCTAVIQSLGKPPRKADCQADYYEPACVVPTGTGVDAMIEEAINCSYSEREESNGLSFSLAANTAQLGKRASRAVIEVAATNYVFAMIETLE